MTIGSRIAKCRKEKNLSQEYIAEMLEVSRQAVSKWECDITEPDTGNLIALSNLLGVSVEYLAKGETAEKAVLVEKKSPAVNPKTKKWRLPKADNIKNFINKKSIIITIVVVLGIIATVISGILISNAREKAFRKATWFSEEWLAECGVEGLPRIGGEYKAKIGESEVLVEMKSQENFEMYVEAHLLCMYLRERHFRHLGSRGQILSCDKGLIVYELVPGEDISAFRHSHGKYIFVFSNTRTSDGDVEATVISLEWVGNQEIIVEGKPVSYNVVMSVYPENHNESYKLRTVATYNISYEGDTSIYYSAPPITAIAVHRVVIRTHPLDGADIVLYANGVPIEKTYEGDGYWEYTFRMPSQNVVITAEIVGDSE